MEDQPLHEIRSGRDLEGIALLVSAFPVANISAWRTGDAQPLGRHVGRFEAFNPGQPLLLPNGPSAYRDPDRQVLSSPRYPDTITRNMNQSRPTSPTAMRVIVWLGGRWNIARRGRLAAAPAE